MTESPLFSEHWHRVRHLKPRLADDVVVVQQLYREVPTWILHRRSTTDYQRLGAAAWWLVQRFDGSTCVDEVWRQTLHTPGGEAPTQNQFIDLLSRMHEADLLVVDRRIGVESLFARGEDRRRRDRRREKLNPLFARFALVDPDVFLSRLSRTTQGLTSQRFSLFTLVLSFFTLWMLLPRTDELYTQMRAFDPFEPSQVLSFILIYPLMKLVHELAHGVVLKRYGGEVREAGVAVMVLIPLPYIDASDAILLRDKYKRMLVSAAGVISELTIALLAALVWCLSDGELQQLALTVVVIGGVSTLIFNGNPLLRFDAYYLLADAIEIPNLYSRSQQALVDVGRRYLLGLAPIAARVDDPAERRWLLGYGVASGLFRIALLLSIALLLGSRYFLFGVAMALWIVFSVLVLPMWRFCRSSIDAPADRVLRARTSACLMVVLPISLAFVPLPRQTIAEGIVWLPDAALVRAPEDCLVNHLHVTPGQRIAVDAPLLDCSNQDLITERAIVRAELLGLVAEHSAADTHDAVQRRVLSLAIDEAKGRLSSLSSRLAALELRTTIGGEFIVADSANLTNRWFRRGELIAYVLPEFQRHIRLALPETATPALEDGPLQIEFLLVGDRQQWQVYHSSYSGETGQAVRRIRHAALTQAGGGVLDVVDGPEGAHLRDPVFEIEIPWPEGVPVARVGSRVQARLSRPFASVFDRMQERLRRLDLDRNAA